MDLTSKREIRKVLQRYYARPLKKLGQHFLINKGVLAAIMKAAEIKPYESVLEIGPGTGCLTIELSKKAKNVLAIEKDAKMVEILKETLADCKNVKIVHGNALKLTGDTTVDGKYKVVANLPYNIASRVIRIFIESKKPPEMVLMVQKEVGQRICARPPDMNILACAVQFYAEPKILRYVSRKSFWPQPRVDAAIIKITPTATKENGSPVFRRRFFKIIGAGFSHPRKQLISNLFRGLKMERGSINNLLLRCSVNPSLRAENLNISEWINVVKMINLR